MTPLTSTGKTHEAKKHTRDFNVRNKHQTFSNLLRYYDYYDDYYYNQAKITVFKLTAFLGYLNIKLNH
jgi:hypothetical protein